MLQAQEYAFRSFNADNGLSTYNASKIIQDPFGFIWIATQAGINRFDGREFIIIKKGIDSSEGLSENAVTDMLIDSKNQLWVSSALGGIDILDIERLHVKKRLHHQEHNKKPQLISNWVRSIARDDSNKTWIGTYKGLSIYDEADGSFFNIQETPIYKNQKPFSISCIKKSPDGLMWVAVENRGIFLFKTATKKPERLITLAELNCNEQSRFQVNDIFFSSANRVFISTTQGLRQLFLTGDYQVSKTVSFNIETGGMNISCIRTAPDGNYWIGTEEGVYIATNAGNIVKKIEKDFFNSTSLTDNKIQHIFFDKSGNAWISTIKGICFSNLQPRQFRVLHYDYSTQNKLDHVYTLYPDTDSTLYVCSSSGLFNVNTGTGKISGIPSSIPYGIFNDIFRISETGLLAATAKGLVFVNTVSHQVINASKVFPELKDVQRFIYSSHLALGDSLVLLGSEEEEGLVLWNTVKKECRQFKIIPGDSSGILDNHIHNIRQDKAGDVWIVSDMVLSRFQPAFGKFFHHFPKPGKIGSINSFFLMDFYDDGNNKWVTTYGGGINKWNVATGNWQALTEKEGLADNCTYNILPENDSIIWISSNHGLSQLNVRNNKFSNYYLDDGLQSNSFDERSACKWGDKLYFGGINGFTEITPIADTTARHEYPVYISKLSYQQDGKLNEANNIHWPSLQFPFRANSFTFYLSTPVFHNPHKCNFSYRIPELNNDWIELGNKNTIHFLKLQPGNYQLMVRMSTQDGLRQEQEAAISIRIMPPWYQTWWFYTLLAMVVSAIIYALFQYRLNQKLKVFSLRQHIHRDLHDDVGATLSSVKVYSEILQNNPDNPLISGLIKENATEMIDKLEVIAWATNPQRDTFKSLQEKMRKFALPLCHSKGIQISFDFQDINDSLMIPGHMRQNLFLVFKESVHNMIKYAQASSCSVSFLINRLHFQMQINDDGIGYDGTIKGTGNGWKNMHKRADELKGELKIESAPGKGTSITMSLPYPFKIPNSWGRKSFS